MARKRVLPRYFPLAIADWEEIYNALDSPDGAIRKMPPDGHGMEQEKAQARLSEKDWIEIYLSIESTLDSLKGGFYGKDRLTREWITHMKEILRVLSPVRKAFIGGKAA